MENSDFHFNELAPATSVLNELYDNSLLSNNKQKKKTKEREEKKNWNESNSFWFVNYIFRAAWSTYKLQDLYDKFYVMHFYVPDPKGPSAQLVLPIVWAQWDKAT